MNSQKKANVQKIREFPYMIISESLEKFCKRKGFKAILFTTKNYGIISETIDEINLSEDEVFGDVDIVHNILKSLESVGRPDFFLYNKTEYFFVEYKSRGDYLNKGQLEWFYKHPDFPIIVIHNLLENRSFTDIVQKLKEQENEIPYKMEATENENSQ